MAQTLKFGNGTWATKKDSILAYNDENENYKPLPFNYTGFGKGTRVNKEGLIEVVENDRPRIDYTDSEDGVFLLENAATNLATLSELFSGWSHISNATVTSNYTISPEGVINATRLQFTGNGYLFNLNSPAQVNGTQYTLSCYAKRNDSETQSFGFFSNGSTNVDNAMVLTNEWKRFYYTYTASNSLQLGLSGLSGADVSVYGFQVEVGNASSYIPTQGSIQTRVAETASDSGNSEVFNDSEGVLFADIAALSDDGTSRRISLTDVSGSTFLNLVSIELDESSGILKAFVSDNTNIGILQGNIIQTQYNKIALKYNASSISLYVNGFELDSNNTPNLPNGLKILDFNNGQSNQISEFYGKTKELGYYDTALTDLELETLTSYRTWESMVNELNLNVIYNG